MFCLADVTLHADPYGTDKRADEASTRALEQMPVHADQLSPLVKSSGNCLPSSSNYSCSAVYQVTSLFCCKNRILRTSAADGVETHQGIQPRRECLPGRCQRPRCPPARWAPAASRPQRSLRHGQSSATRASAPPSPASATLERRSRCELGPDFTVPFYWGQYEWLE